MPQNCIRAYTTFT